MSRTQPFSPEPTHVIACGALASEILAICKANNLEHINLHCLPANLHTTPDKIPAAVQKAIQKARQHHKNIFVAYGDCGTAGALDKVLQDENVARIEGAHCYAFFTGLENFDQMADAEPGTFYLTDFLARQFHSFVIKPLGLDRFPQLRNDYFGNYTRLLYLAQTDNDALNQKAKEAAQLLDLKYERQFVGYGILTETLKTGAKL